MGWVRAARELWELGVAWVMLLLAWALLAYFSMLREEIIETAGAADEANEWGFGQVLTLGTWVPVVLEWLYIFCAVPLSLHIFLGMANSFDAGGIKDGVRPSQQH